MTNSPEREQYHIMMRQFIGMIKPGSLVYDIGVSSKHQYRQIFKGFDYLTIDRDPGKEPDILSDIEYADGAALQLADALLCNGVVEQCSDPMAMLKGCKALLNKKGLALFGFVLLGYPQYDNDAFRFTEFGAIAALERLGYTIITTSKVNRYDQGSYIFAICSA